MLEDRSATIGSHDRKNLTKLQLKQQKRHKVERKKVELSKARAQFEVTPSENISCSSSTSDSGNSQDEIPGCSATPMAHRRTVKTGAILEIPYDILSKSSVVEVMTRCGISPSAGSAFLQSILLESQYSGNEELTESQLLSKFTLSYASCDRYKRKQNYSMSEIIKESWTPPMIYNIHWDSKLVPQFQDKYNKIEIMPVLVSNGSNTKLLGVPSFCPGAEQSVGSIIGDFTYNLLIEWNYTIDGATSMVFDTTSTNTGLWSGGCVELQNRLNKSLLWCACRKHIGELIVGSVFNALQIKMSKSPEIMIFKNFQSNFSHVCQDDISYPPYLEELDCYSDSELSFLNELRKDATDLATKLLTKKDNSNLPREDYKELLELLLF